jgi:hypothetical protein
LYEKPEMIVMYDNKEMKRVEVVLRYVGKGRVHFWNYDDDSHNFELVGEDVGLESFDNRAEKREHTGPFTYFSETNYISKVTPHAGFYGLNQNVAYVRNLEKKVGGYLTPSQAWKKDWNVKRFALSRD